MPAAAHFRAFPRRELALRASVETSLNGTRPARLINIGLGGACLELPDRLEVGQRATLHVEIPVLWDPLVAEGRVVWADPERARIGLCFDHTNTRLLRPLVELLGAGEFASL
jgi:Tfp pilus assembly protein PilZ